MNIIESLSFSQRVKLAQEINDKFDAQDKNIERSTPAFPPKGFDIEKWKAHSPKCSRNALGVLTVLQGLGYSIKKLN